MTPYEEYIAHHGILGQKWGKKNGPPYPLGRSVSTGSRLKSIFSRKKKVVRSGGSEEYKKQQKLNKSVDKAKEKSKQISNQAKEEVRKAYAKEQAQTKAASQSEKEKILKLGTAKEVASLFNKIEITNDELSAVEKRLSLEKDVRDLIIPEKTKWDKLDLYSKRTKQLSDALSASIDAYQNTEKLVKIINEAIEKNKKK